MADEQRAALPPAQHVIPAPEGGWRGADVADAELVDDAHIEADPASRVVAPMPQFVYESDRQKD